MVVKGFEKKVARFPRLVAAKQEDKQNNKLCSSANEQYHIKPQDGNVQNTSHCNNAFAKWSQVDDFETEKFHKNQHTSSGAEIWGDPSKAATYTNCEVHV